MVSHGFDLYSLIANDVKHLFMCLLIICIWRNVYSDPLLIKKVVLSFHL